MSVVGMMSQGILLGGMLTVVGILAQGILLGGIQVEGLTVLPVHHSLTNKLSWWKKDKTLEVYKRWWCML